GAAIAVNDERLTNDDGPLEFLVRLVRFEGGAVPQPIQDFLQVLFAHGTAASPLPGTPGRGVGGEGLFVWSAVHSHQMDSKMTSKLSYTSVFQNRITLYPRSSSHRCRCWSSVSFPRCVSPSISSNSATSAQ